MRIQTTIDYAVRILRHIYLYQKCSTQSIVDTVDVPLHSVNQILSRLKRSGLLIHTKGEDGGYQLSRPLEEISLYDIYTGVKGELRISRCLADGRQCYYGEMEECKMNKAMRSLQGKMIEEMSGMMLADLVL